MNLNCKSLEQVLNLIENEKIPLHLTGVCDISKAHIISSIFERFKKPVLVIEKNDFSAKTLSDNIDSFLSNSKKTLLYQTREFNFFNAGGFSREYERQRIKVLSQIVDNPNRIVVSSAAACLQRTIPKNEFLKNVVKLKVGDEISISTLLKKFLLSGYVKRNNIDGTHQFAQRGDIVDIFTSDYENPIRIEFFDEIIDSINFFDIETQRRMQKIDSVFISPSVEVLTGDYEEFSHKLKSLSSELKEENQKFIEDLNRSLEDLSSGAFFEGADKFLPICYDEKETILDYFKDYIVIISESFETMSSLDSFIKLHNETIVDYLEKNLLVEKTSDFIISKQEFKSRIEPFCFLEIETFARSTTFFNTVDLIDIQSVSCSKLPNRIDIIKEEVQGYLYSNKSVIIFSENEKYCKILVEDLKKDGIDALFTKNLNSINLKKVYVVAKNISSGFFYKGEHFVVLSVSSKAQGKSKKTKSKNQNSIKSIDDIKVGDLIVHEHYGIGRYCGIFNIDTDGIKKDYIKIQYNSSDVLYLPIINMDLISKYISSGDDNKVKLSKLHTSDWKKTKSKVYTKAKSMVKELISLYAKRSKEKGFSFSNDDDLQYDFENRFEFIETDAQLRCIDEIKNDMQKSTPMERLLCGDVGFGKTEVALRAAFKCVNDSKQCVILAPTTILAWQHYITVSKRMENFPVNVELLSRFRTKKQQDEIIKKVNSGEIDIIIGTHRLVQDDVKFKSLGLCIIDEEQRFGVKHKEKFKTLFPGVDVLTLSATPIPRTLNFVLSGIRDMSIIDEAPIDRIPIQTYVMEYDEDIIIDAIINEKRRGGQTYYLYNNTTNIEMVANRIRSLVDDIVVEVAHGKMSESSITKIWERLINGEIDVLVCTTIIETGVDVANCNTLIVENADNMGLSQLYQLRGRIGRSSRRAFCYLTFKSGKILSEISTKRLEAIKEFTNFGSGFKIAMRDLEIRGAGDILGSTQHGHIASVGYDMYMKILNNAILEERGELVEDVIECRIDLPINAFISENYIYDYGVRIDIYKKISSVIDEEQKMDLIDELIDRFGNPPLSVIGLIDVAILKNRAEKIFLKEISVKGRTIYFYCDKFNFNNTKNICDDLGEKYGFDNVTLNPSNKPFISVKLINTSGIFQNTVNILDTFEKFLVD